MGECLWRSLTRAGIRSFHRDCPFLSIWFGNADALIQRTSSRACTSSPEVLRRTRAKERQVLFFGALKCCRVLKILVKALGLTWEQRAALPGVVADCEHVIERLAFELIDVLRAVTGNVNTQFFHHSDRFGPHAPWSCAGALHFETLSCRMLEQAFGHLAAGGIACAEN